MEDTEVSKYENTLSEELKKKWIHALEHEQIKQQSGNLGSCDNKSACALGVLLMVAGYKFVRSPNYRPEATVTNEILDKDGSPISGYAALSALGLPDRVVERIYQLNDNALAPFTEVAAWVKTYV